MESENLDFPVHPDNQFLEGQGIASWAMDSSLHSGLPFGQRIHCPGRNPLHRQQCTVQPGMHCPGRKLKSPNRTLKASLRSNWACLWKVCFWALSPWCATTGVRVDRKKSISGGARNCTLGNGFLPAQRIAFWAMDPLPRTQSVAQEAMHCAARNALPRAKTQIAQPDA